MLERRTRFLISWLVAVTAFVSSSLPAHAEETTIEQRVKEIRGVKPVAPFEAYLDRTYYTREQEARLHADAAFVPEDLKRLYVETALWDGLKLVVRKKTQGNLGRHTVMRFPLAGLKNGTYTLVTHLRNKARGDAAGGYILGTQKLSLVKLPPAPDEVKVDRERRVILVNGKPFFIRGIWFVPTQDYPKVKAAGFNTVVYAGTYSRIIRAVTEDEDHFRPDASGAKMVLAKAAEVGLRAIPKMTTLHNDHPEYLEKFKATVPKMTEAVAEVGRFAAQHRALLGYRTFDEPYNRGGTPEACDLFYRIVKEADPYHLPIMLFSRYVGFDVTDRSELVGAWGYDYLMSGKSVSWRLEKVRRASKIAKRHHLPFLYGFQVDLVSGSRRNLTPPELRCLTYLNLVSDATAGITWFAYNPRINHPATWEELKRLNQEIEQLAPVLLTESLPGKVSGTEELEGIHVSLKQHEGRLYLIAVNGAFNTIAARFTLPSMAASSRVKVLFEDRTIQAEDGGFADRFSGQGTHVYQITPRRGKATSHDIDVSSTKLQETYDPTEYYARQESRAVLSSEVIFADGRDNTLASISRDVNNSQAFDYSAGTRTAATPHIIRVSHKSRLILGDKDDAAKGETLKILGTAGRRGFHSLWGHLEIYNSKLVNCPISTRLELGRVLIRNSEIVGLDRPGVLGTSRSGAAKTYDVNGLEIHGCAAPLDWNAFRGPYINCKIHDNKTLADFPGEEKGTGPFLMAPLMEEGD